MTKPKRVILITIMFALVAVPSVALSSGHGIAPQLDTIRAFANYRRFAPVFDTFMWGQTVRFTGVAAIIVMIVNFSLSIVSLLALGGIVMPITA